MQALVSGAIQGEDGSQGVTGVLFIFDLDRGEKVYQTEYHPPAELVCEGQKIQFTGYCFIDQSLYVCSHNEVLVFDHWPPRQPDRRITVPGLNDLHHCYPWQGHLAVSNTGLETVDLITLDGNLVERYDLLKNEQGPRHVALDDDIRLRADTKPHLRHGNHLFEMGGALWTGQLRTFDAVRVDDLSQRIEMGVGMPHDGTLIHGKIVFTTTNGHLVFFDAEPPHERTVYNLNDLTPDFNQLAWCRGVCGIGDEFGRYLVTFSALRRSVAKEFGYWIKHGHKVPSSHIAEYDLREGGLVRRWWIGERPGYQLFQIDLLPESRWV